MNETAYLSIREVSLRCHRSEKSVRQWMKRGLPSYRPDSRILLRWDEVQEWIERSRSQVAADQDVRNILAGLFGQKKTV